MIALKITVKCMFVVFSSLFFSIGVFELKADFNWVLCS